MQYTKKRKIEKGENEKRKTVNWKMLRQGQDMLVLLKYHGEIIEKRCVFGELGMLNAMLLADKRDMNAILERAISACERGERLIQTRRMQKLTGVERLGVGQRRAL